MKKIVRWKRITAISFIIYALLYFSYNCVSFNTFTSFQKLHSILYSLIYFGAGIFLLITNDEKRVRWFLLAGALSYFVYAFQSGTTIGTVVFMIISTFLIYSYVIVAIIVSFTKKRKAWIVPIVLACVSILITLYSEFSTGAAIFYDLSNFLYLISYIVGALSICFYSYLLHITAEPANAAKTTHEDEGMDNSNSVSNMSADELNKYYQLLKDGVITKEDFDNIKSKALNK